jgi:phosphatidylinositol alpha-1,6-mannosyltransferase
MSRIALAAGVLAPGQGGIASVARMSHLALIHAGHSVDVISYLDRTAAELPAKARVAKGSKLAFSYLCYSVALGADWLLFDSAGVARARPRLPGFRRPYAVWMHGVEAWEAARPQTLAAYRDAALVIVNSRHTLRRFEQLHGRLPNAAVCWLATEADEGPTDPALFTDPPSVLILSRIDRGEGYKGHDVLISCWPRVSAAVPGAKLIIAGGGSGLASIRALSQASPASASIEVLGFVPEAQLPALWKRAHVFAMPSKGEGFGLVYVEAMRQGLPVIAARADAGEEVNLDGVTGYNVDPGAEADLTARLIALLGNSTHARAMGEAARQRWQHYFRFSSFCSRFNDAIEKKFMTCIPPA